MKIFFLIVVWLFLAFLSFGVTGFHFFSMGRMAKKPYSFKTDKNYLPKVSIIIPTHNEARIVRFKLLNIIRVDYPKSLLQLIIVDSNSNDGTLEIAKDFASEHSEFDFNILSLNEKGKSTALNFALKHSTGDVIVISDVDCFYPRDILRNSVYYLSDPNVGAISGPKILMDENSSNVLKAEERYLKSMNLVKKGESKFGFSPLFEGGFSAYRKEALSSFDPYNTGSDDCGTVVKLAENSYGALFAPEGAFFTTFPLTWKERLGMKLRRANQLVRVFGTYLRLLLKKRIKVGKRIILTNVYIYLFSPIFFVLFLLYTVIVLVNYPYVMLLLLILFIPKAGPILIEVIQSYIILFCSLFAVASKKKFLVWSKPADRDLLTEEMLSRRNFI